MNESTFNSLISHLNTSWVYISSMFNIPAIGPSVLYLITSPRPTLWSIHISTNVASPLIPCTLQYSYSSNFLPRLSQPLPNCHDIFLFYALFLKILLLTRYDGQDTYLSFHFFVGLCLVSRKLKALTHSKAIVITDRGLSVGASSD